MFKYRFHKKGFYAHADPKMPHVEVSGPNQIHCVNSDMASRCERYGWAEKVDESASGETEGHINEKSEVEPEASAKAETEAAKAETEAAKVESETGASAKVEPKVATAPTGPVLKAEGPSALE